MPWQKKHGLSKHPLYYTWAGMVHRCTNPNNSHYADYGGRGIKVCDRWLGEEGVRNFLADMGPRPDGHEIDRRDNDGPYSPDNCRWATRSEQLKNRRKLIPAATRIYRSKTVAIGPLAAILLRQIWIRTPNRRDGRRPAIGRAFGISYSQAHRIGTGRDHQRALEAITTHQDPTE